MDLINQSGLYESSKKPEAEKDRLRVSGKELAIGVDYDKIDVTYPTTTTENYAYSKNANNVLTILVNYLTAAKKDITTVEVI